MTAKRSNVAERAIALCKKLKKCTKNEVAFWLQIAPSTSYTLWSYLISICAQGLLDTASEKCIYDTVTDSIIFSEKSE